MIIGRAFFNALIELINSQKKSRIYLGSLLPFPYLNILPTDSTSLASPTLIYLRAHFQLQLALLIQLCLVPTF